MTMGDESFVTEIIFSSKNAAQISPSKSNTTSPGKILFLPKNEFLFYMDSSQVFQDKMKKVGVSSDKQLNQLIRKYGQFSFKDSQLTQHPKPIQGIVFKSNRNAKETIHVQCIWFKDKIKVYEMKTEPVDF
jgi:hypothetical protein